jgi:hypothetical protein
MASKLQRLRIHDIDIGRGYCQYDAVGLGYIFGDEIPSLLFDVRRLISDRNLHVVSFETSEHENGEITFVNPGKSTSVKLKTCGE